MKSVARIFATVVVLAPVALTTGRSLQAGTAGETIPAFHMSPSSVPLGPTLRPSEFAGDLVTQRAYSRAATIRGLLFQLPCYCHCDREAGHSSLLSCYQDRHAVHCATCKMELFYAYAQNKAGKTPSQIREGIIRGDWKSVDLSRNTKPTPRD